MKTNTILAVLCISALILCVSAAKHKGAKTEEVSAKSEGSESCLICGYLVGKVEGYELHNLTEAQIITNLENDCKTSYKGLVADACLAIVKKYGIPIIKAVGDGIAPDQICKDLGLCDTNNVVISEPVQPFKPHDKKLKLNKHQQGN